MCHIWRCMKSKKFFQLQWKIKIIQFFVFEFFCMILVRFLGNHIWSLYDYQEIIQIICDLVWLLRIIYDLVRNQRKLYDRWPGYGFLFDLSDLFRLSTSTICTPDTKHVPINSTLLCRKMAYASRACNLYARWWTNSSISYGLNTVFALKY